jgi:hypothetical protein
MVRSDLLSCCHLRICCQRVFALPSVCPLCSADMALSAFYGAGGAWHGALQDFDNNMDSGSLPIMTMEDMSSALGAALGGEKLDIISFDACLMAAQGVAAALSSHAHYLIGSELSIMVSSRISDPWNHRAHVPHDGTSPMLPEEYGIHVVDDFVDCGGRDTMQTMSLISLDEYPAFSQAMADVATLLTAAAAADSPTSDLLVSALQVVNNLDSDYGSLGGQDNDMGSYGADVGAFLLRWAALLDDRSSPEAATAAAAARTASGLFDTMIVHERCGQDAV